MDLTIVDGMSPANARRLADAGIESAEELAVADVDDVHSLLKGRRGGSLKDVTALVAAAVDASDRHDARRGAAGASERSATFTVKLAIDPSGAVRRTEVADARTGEAKRIGGFDVADVDRFIRRNAHVGTADGRTPAAAAARAATARRSSEQWSELGHLVGGRQGDSTHAELVTIPRAATSAFEPGSPCDATVFASRLGGSDVVRLVSSTVFADEEQDVEIDPRRLPSGVFRTRVCLVPSGV